jgi:hypothetical protein
MIRDWYTLHSQISERYQLTLLLVWQPRHTNLVSFIAKCVLLGSDKTFLILSLIFLVFGEQVWLLIYLDQMISSNTQKVACTAQAIEATFEILIKLMWITFSFRSVRNRFDLFYCLLLRVWCIRHCHLIWTSILQPVPRLTLPNFQDIDL